MVEQQYTFGDRDMHRITDAQSLAGEIDHTAVLCLCHVSQVPTSPKHMANQHGMKYPNQSFKLQFMSVSSELCNNYQRNYQCKATQDDQFVHNRH